MQDLLFDTPVWLLAALAVVAVAVWVSGNARQENRLKLGAYAVLGLAALLLALSYFVDTDRETVEKRTRELVATVEKKDQATAERLLHSRVNLAGMDKAAIVARVGTAADQFKLKDIKVTSLSVQTGGEGALIATVGVSTGFETMGFGGTAPTNWRVTWEKLDRGWVAREIEPLSNPVMDAATLTAKAKGN